MYLLPIFDLNNVSQQFKKYIEPKKINLSLFQLRTACGYQLFIDYRFKNNQLMYGYAYAPISILNVKQNTRYY